MSQPHEQGVEPSERPNHRYRHPQWEKELISYPDGRELIDAEPTAPVDETAPEAPQFAPETLASDIGNTALRSA